MSCRTWSFIRKRYVAKSIPFISGPVACQRKWWCGPIYITVRRRGIGKGGPWSRSARSWAKLPTADHLTHQWRGDALEEPRKAFLACDGHQRVKGGAVSGVWRWVLEPVFHLIQQMAMMALSQSELKRNRERGKGRNEGTKERRRGVRTGVKWKTHNQTRDACNGASEKIDCWVKFVLWADDADDISVTVPLGSTSGAPFSSPGKSEVDIKWVDSMGHTRQRFFFPRGGISRLAHRCLPSPRSITLII